ncbi:MAG: hypothetical protein DRJ03_08035 [Chloroflexi bacterium]|nr:MAG: hypothetical protein DRJ03_08035 [Chloroflexota bacterium]
MPKAVKYMGVWIKQCSKCGEFKKVEEFYRDSSKDDGLFNWCKKCKNEGNMQWRANNRERHNAYSTQWRASNPKRYWAMIALKGHRRRGFNIEITTDNLFDLAENTEECWICGCKLDWSICTKSGKPQSNSPSLDRIDNGNVLTLNNIQIICYRCNVAKSMMSMKEFVEYCKNVVDRNSYLMEC